MNPPSTCATVGALSSHWLDRRLAPAARARVELHLRGCAECRVEYRDLARLSRAVAQLPRPEPSPMAARRAMQAAARLGAAAPWVATPARTSWRDWAGRAAAGLLVAIALGATWWRGGARERSVVEVAASEPVVSPPESIVAAPMPASAPASVPTLLHEVDSAPDYARAARSVLADVAAIDEVAPPLRQPLLGAQIRVFGLDAWAARPARADDSDAELVGLVRRLEDALATRDDAPLYALQRTLRSRDGAALAATRERPRAAAPRSRLEVPRFTRAQADAVVDSYADLPPAERAPLSDLLEAKASWIAGDLEGALQQARERAPRDEHSGFSVSYRVLFVLSAGEAGGSGGAVGPASLDALKEQVNRAIEDALGEALKRLPARRRPRRRGVARSISRSRARGV